MANSIAPLSRFIEKSPQGKRWVVGDVHGCPETLKKLIKEKIQLTHEDQLFFLGDYIDRGPDSGAVIDYLLELEEENYQIFPLRGNHEQMLLDDIEECDGNLRELKAAHRLNKRYGMTANEGNVLPHYIEFIEMLPYYYELDAFFLVHAGFNFRLPCPFEYFNDMLWIREHTHDKEHVGKKRIVHGHTPTDFQFIQKEVQSKGLVIPLDNGCVFARYLKDIGLGSLGRLCALNLDTFELVYQENIEPEVLKNEIY